MPVGKTSNLNTLDLDVGRTRILLSLLGIVSLWVDPTTAGGLFHLAPAALATLVCHLGYSVGTYLALKKGVAARQLPLICNGLDLFFAAAVALLTEGQTSPSFMFFVFAIAAAGVRMALRRTLMVTLLSVSLYAVVTALFDGASASHLMRAIYLGATGYLVALFVRQMARFQARLGEMETRAQREFIARSLHDDYIQVLAGVNLRLETCQELLRRQSPQLALKEIEELQLGVARQFDEIRSYVRSLAGVEIASRPEQPAAWLDPRVQMKVTFSARSLIAEHILQIMLEGLRNARRHGAGSKVSIKARQEADQVKITIDDDGAGFHEEATAPWTIVSRVAEFGGRLSLRAGSAGLEIEMPAT
jgi:signal transduction histidine kinase